MVRPVTRIGGENASASGADGDDAPRLGTAPTLSDDEIRSVIFIIRSARAIAFLQRFVPPKYLPPPEERIPQSVLKRLIHELKKLIPRWKWISPARGLPRNGVKLGEEFFYAITALRTSRLELWRAGYTDCVAALDDVYAVLFSIGNKARARRGRVKSNQSDAETP